MKLNDPKVASTKLPLALIFSFIVIGILSALLLHLYSSRPKIAYVKTLELVYGYNGMKEAHSDFKVQTDAWQSNIDTLRINYERALARYKQKESDLSSKEQEEQKIVLKRMEADLNNYASIIQEQATDKEKKLTEAVLNQINSYVESYARGKGYDIVLGAEGSGSIVFASDAYDITKDVLAALNQEYKRPDIKGSAVSLKRPQ